MKLLVAVLVALAGLLAPCSSILPEINQVHTKFQFMHSFKGPYLVDSKGNIPFWNHGGSAIPSEESIRVCPSIKSRRGWVWSKNTLSASNWFVDVSVKVTGRLKAGADGMAIWATAHPGEEGPVYGNSATWKGIALFLDSFDNDGLGDNPKIQLVLNDGTRPYEHYSDGKTQQSGSCLKDFRNRPYPVKIRMSYVRGTLEVWVHEGISLSEDDYELCTKLEGVQELSRVPAEVYFGVSAATGGLSDDHDVLSFLTYSVSTMEDKAAQEILSNETAFNEVVQKYDQLSGEFEQRRDNYLRQHPELTPQSSGTESRMDWQSELEMEQNMRLVADMQVALQKEIRAVSRKVDVVIASRGGGNLERTGSVPDASSANSMYSSLTADMAQIKSVDNNILHQLADLRAAMDRSVPEGGKATASEQLQPLYEVKNLVAQQQLQLEAISTQIQELSRNKCPPPSSSPSSCLTSWLFVAVVIVQMAILIGYSCYRDTQERNAKKFF